jgi:hypothetical protein
MVERLLVLRGRAVRPDRRERVERVGDGHDPGSERNIRAAKARGVSTAVEALVMVADDPRELGISEAVDHRGTLGGVTLDDLELVRSQRVGLGQQRRRDA